MLGLGRASQYAGWWGGGPININMAAPVDFVSTQYQTPAYSFLYNASDRNWTVNPDGTYNLSGYSSLTGFNNLRYTVLNCVYLPWASGLADGYYGTTIAVELRQTGQSSLNLSGILDIVSGSLKITYGYANTQPQLTLPGAYTNYTNRWLTIVNCGAETSSVYSNWSTSSTSGTNYLRLAVFDTETGELLGKTDYRDSANRRSISAYGSTSISASVGNADSVAINGFSGGGEQIRQSNLWYSFGTMFDPLTETAGAWRTTRIPQTIGTGSAWLSQSFTTYNTTSSNYYADSATGIYSVTGNYNVRIAQGATAFTTGYSDTIFPQEQS
jgi:hypothetical protein